MKKFLKSSIHLIDAFGRKLQYDHVSAHAAECAFFIFVSFFPFAMFLLSLIQFLPFSEQEMLELFSKLIPEAVMAVVTPLFDEIYSAGTATVISVTIITALWTASKGFASLTVGLNSIYHIRDQRNYIQIKVVSILYTLFFAVFLIFLLALSVLGGDISTGIKAKIPFLQGLPFLSFGVRFAVSAIVFTGLGLMLYIVIPKRKAKIMRELPGAIISGVGWVLYSYLYSLYISNMSNMTATYGSLTAIVLCMIWLYFCMYITYLGAEINMVINHTIVSRTISEREKE